MSNSTEKIRKNSDKSRKKNQARDAGETQLWVEETCGRLFCSSNAILRQIESACADIRKGREERSQHKESDRKVDTSTSPRTKTATAKGGQPPRKAPKWQQTDLGKSLKVLVHVTSKIEAHKADETLVTAWRNVQGTVGGAISRAKRKDPPAADAAIRDALDGMTSLTDEASPKEVVAEVNKLFRDESYTEPSESDVIARRLTQRETRVAKRKAKNKDNPK